VGKYEEVGQDDYVGRMRGRVRKRVRVRELQGEEEG